MILFIALMVVIFVAGVCCFLIGISLYDDGAYGRCLSCGERYTKVYLEKHSGRCEWCEGELLRMCAKLDKEEELWGH